MIIFRCCTMVHLFNAIHMKVTLFPDQEADLILNKTTDFSSILFNLKKSNLFRSIFETDDSLVYQFSEEKSAKAYFNSFQFSSQYTDMFIGVPYATDIYLFNYIKKRSPNLRINCYEEGQISYLLNWPKKVELSCASKKIVCRFMSSINKCYLYVPSLYCGKGFENRLETIPQVSEKEKSLFDSVFLPVNLPEEKFIFLEENFIGDHNCATDIDCLDDVANIVGKENIIVKQHPRSEVDRFTSRGYKVMDEMRVPWEHFLLSGATSRKIIITVSSGGSITGNVMFNNFTSAINLFRYILIGSNYHVREPSFKKYFLKLMQYANENEPHVFNPSCYQELVDVIKYVTRLGR